VSSHGSPAGGDEAPWARGRKSEGPSSEGAKSFRKDRFKGPRDRKDDRPREEGPKRFGAGRPGAAPSGKIRDRPERREDRPERVEPPQPFAIRTTPDRDRPQRGKWQGGKPHRPPASGQYERRDAAFEENGEVWIWGIHAAGAVLNNPKRRISKALVSRNAAHRAGLDPEALPKFAELLDPREIDQRLAPGAVHQGLAVRCKPLDGPDISDAAVQPDKTLVILDSVTDPQNAGAIFRSAAAFGIGGVVMQVRNAPMLGGALAKAAAGAVERVAEIRVVNLSRAIDALRDAGWKVIGLDASADQTLEEAFEGSEPLAIVMGAEGAGIRPGVAKACSGLARIPIGEAMESLNVSNAAAIAFYQASRRNGAPPPPPKAVQAPPEDADGEESE
jgi:23S rRNA (guanosine2251-2'-O)-methyltransferase